MIDMLENVRVRLKKSWGKRVVIATETGMSEDSLRRIRDGRHMKRLYDPGYSKVKTLSDYFRKVRK